MKNINISVLTAVALCLAAFPAGGATVMWTNTLSGYWNAAVNWSPNTVPGSSDLAVITNAGVTVYLAGATTVGAITVGTSHAGTGALALNGQTLALNGPLAVNSGGSFAVDSGALVGNTNAVLSGTIGWTGGALAGTLTLAAGSTMNIQGGADHDLPNCVFTNNGTVAWAGGRVRGGSGGTAIYNNGLWDCQGDFILNNDYGGNGTMFNNYGAFRKSAGTNTSQTLLAGGVVFNQFNGAVDVQSGNLLLQGGGNFAGGTATNLLGFIVLNAGAFNINGTLCSTNVQLNGGVLVGANVLSGGFNWVFGDWSAAASVTVPAGSILLVTSAADHNLPNVIFTNNGTVAWSNGRIRGGSGGTAVYNNGLWDCQADLVLNNDYGGNSTIFYNAGIFRKSASAGSVTVLFPGVIFNNTGALDVRTNAVYLQGGGNFTGGTATNLLGLIVLNAGAFNINGTLCSTNVQLNGGVLVGANVLSGGFNWVYGDWNAATSVTVPAGSVLLVTSPADHNLPNIIFTNNGTVAWSNGRIRGGSGGTSVYNNGLWDCQADVVLNNDFGGNSSVFNNTGIFRKSAGTNTSQTLIGSGVLFNQLSGIVDVQTGNLVLQGSGNFTGGFITTNQLGLTILSAGNFNLNGTVTTSNTIENAGNLVGTSVIRGALTWAGGTWNNTVTIAPNSAVLLAGGTANMYLYNCIVTNYGAFAWASGYPDGGSVAGTLVYNYGLWDCQSDYSFKSDGGGINTVFNNYGTFRKSGGTNISQTLIAGGVLFNQLNGTVDVQTGNLVLQGGGNFTGGFVSTNPVGITVLSVGNFNVNGTVTTSNTIENVGNLVGNNVIHGALTWAGGAWNNTVTIAPNSTVFLAGGTANMFLYNCIVTNYGTFTWVSGCPDGGSAGTFVYNYGLWDCQGDYPFKNDGGGNNTVFNNYGTFRKSAGTNTSQTLMANGVLFNQLSGTVDVQTGNLLLQGGGNFTGGSVSANPLGLTVLSSGNFNVNGTVTTTNTVENAGSLTGINLIQGGLTWSGGGWNNSVVTIAPNSTVQLAGGTANMYFYNCIVTNYGTFVWTSGCPDGGGVGTFVYNYGLWDCQGDYPFKDDGGGNNTVFNNYGTFRKSAGTNASQTLMAGGVLFNQLSGVVDVQSGNLLLQGGGNFTGGYLTTNQMGSTILSIGNFTLNGTVTTTNTIENAGNLVGINLIQGGLTWSGGGWNNSVVTIASNSAVILAGGTANMYFLNCVVTNYGVFAWASGYPDGGSIPGTFVYNYGLWDCQGDYNFKSDGAGNNCLFNNYGTFRKSAGNDTGQTLLQGGVFMNDLGVLDVQAGWLALQGGYNLDAGRINFGINSLTNYGKLSLPGLAQLSGAVSANLNNGYQPVSGNSFTNLFYGSFGGLFSSAVLPAADAWRTNYYPTFFVLDVLNARPVFAALSTNVFVVDELAGLAVTNTATDTDLPAQALTYSLASGVNGMNVNPATGVFTWTPQQTNSPSTNIISVAVTDNGLPPLSATNSYTIIVREVNVAPLFAAISNQTVNALSLLTVTNSATDANIHAVLSYALAASPAGMTINSNGVISWTPDRSQGPGTNVVTTIVTATDQFDQINPQLSATNTFQVVVFAPKLAPIGNYTVNPGQTVSFTAVATDYDPHRTLTFSVTAGPGSIVGGSGLFSWRPPVSSAGAINNVQVTVTDNGVPPLSDSRQFTITVNPLANVTVTPVAYANGQFTLKINGTGGPDYVIATSTNLLQWRDSFTNLSPSVPFDFMDPTAGGFRARFYRVRLEP